MTAIENPGTTRVPQNEKAVFWPSSKTKTARLSIIVRGSACMLSSEGFGMTISTQTAPRITGPLQAPPFVTNSGISLKKNFHFYDFVPGDGRSRHCGKRITTAGSGPRWLGKLGRHHSRSGLMTLMMAASASASERTRSLRNPRNPRIPMVRSMNRLIHLDRRTGRLGRPLFLL